MELKTPIITGMGEEFDDAVKQLKDYWMGNIDLSQLASRIESWKIISERKKCFECGKRAPKENWKEVTETKGTCETILECPNCGKADR